MCLWSKWILFSITPFTEQNVLHKVSYKINITIIIIYKSA